MYRDARGIAAVLTLGRDRLGLEVAAALAHEDAAALEALVSERR